MQLLQWQPYVYLWSVWSQWTSSVPPIGTPASVAVDYVNPMIGNGGITPDGSGGMIPSVAPPFGMTRWVAQTRQNYVSVTPYNHTDRVIHGFQATHQPAIWMGESATFTVVPGTGAVKPRFEDRGMRFDKEDEKAGAAYYTVDMVGGEDEKVKAEMTATSRVGHLRFTFPAQSDPYILIEATRASVLGSSDPNNVTFPQGAITIDPATREISGRNPERQDFLIGPSPAPSFAGYFVARFDAPFTSWGIAKNGSVSANETDGDGAMLSGYVRFSNGSSAVNVRMGVSFISVDQARRNLENEIPDGRAFEETAYETRKAWKDKLDLIQVEGATKENLTTFYTAFFHSLQYPYEQSEDGKYYSGYDDTVHEGASYTGYSIWDTFRAEWAWQIFLVPERISDMVTSMLQDYKEGGWLPMWKNIVETNIMVGTHADVLVSEAVVKGFGNGFDTELAYEAVHKDATVPPGVGYEVRAGLSTVYEQKGWVANDIHSEAASRTLDYAYDDHAVAILAAFLNKTEDAEFFGARSHSAYKSIFNNGTGFMEARNASGAWAGEDQGWTEGDMWAYTFDVPQDIPGLVALKGGNASFVNFLDQHFDGGHNMHTNEPSHHIPYLYSLAGAASKTQERVRDIAMNDYNDTVDGLVGNEDCGQMSAWYLFSSLGFYPVDPVSNTYVVGAPFFDKVTVKLPGAPRPLVISSSGATSKKYVKSLTIDGVALDNPVITHAQIARGANIVFEMSDTPQAWGSATLNINNARGEGAFDSEVHKRTEGGERVEKAEL
ncbi:glycoside hydrolase family 92 protein [Fomitiporia mediterranea MF3/22]|uniref:glycoside hydrolase family 92 protein n=1 Tax=Fomitiporia mediterranea (strain MF3/22) TaxID=694068 RepID=UPI000440894B|nr:glycoside hydrolase family 92 protein [Fomitiporia mediterranea MF3/22]EJD03735.1 glycoside hydrolase family 92 protein [Fomitiporia mediterranea MF3/22]